MNSRDVEVVKTWDDINDFIESVFADYAKNL